MTEDTRTFEPGEEVCWSAGFLASLGACVTDPLWFDVGCIISEKRCGPLRLIYVFWDSQGAREAPMLVLSENLLKKGELSHRTAADRPSHEADQGPWRFQR